jgi:adenylosuccinate lyase
MNCISPIDGRYKEITSELSTFFSEFSFFKYRLFVEIQYFCHLIPVLPELHELKDQKKIIYSIMHIWTSFSTIDYNIIKDYEKTLQHDIKALEYFIRDKFKELNLEKYTSFIHFGITSQDINTSANILSLKDAMISIIIPIITNIKDKIVTLSNDMKYDVMLGFTHGQPAVPTTMGKELFVFAYRLEEQLKILQNMPYSTKFGGAVGNFNAHYAAYPDVQWEEFADHFVSKMGLEREKVTTQISNYDHLCNIFNSMKTINNIMNDMNIDCWLYISKGYLKQKVIDTEIGSSTMPQKVNPIHFENSEGNVCIANAIIEGITRKLSVSRLQRDLTDSTILRNIGTILAYSLISYTSIFKGLNKIDINKDMINKELNNNFSVLSEGIQTILRKNNDMNAYEKLHKLTRDKNFSQNKLEEFILTLPENLKSEINNISVKNYIGHNNLFDI